MQQLQCDCIDAELSGKQLVMARLYSPALGKAGWSEARRGTPQYGCNQHTELQRVVCNGRMHRSGSVCRLARTGTVWVVQCIRYGNGQFGESGVKVVAFFFSAFPSCYEVKLYARDKKEFRPLHAFTCDYFISPLTNYSVLAACLPSSSLLDLFEARSSIILTTPSSSRQVR